MSAKCVKSYFNALVFLSFCYCEVKIYSLFIFSFLLPLFVFINLWVYKYKLIYVSNTIRVTYKNLRNVVPSKEYANICDYVVLKFSNCPIFPRCIKLQYEDEEVNDFIDLDSAIQLNQGKSNRINVLAEEYRDTDSM